MKVMETIEVVVKLKEKIAEANKFALSDEEYEDFKKYVLAETFTYSTASEEVLEKMKKVAEEEGFREIAMAFKLIAKVEEAHEKRYRTLYNNLEEGKVFKRGEKVIWKCRNCGFIHEGTVAPKKCPACLHDQSYFEIKESNY